MAHGAPWEPVVVGLAAPLLLFPAFRPGWTAAALAVLLLAWLLRWLTARRPAEPTPFDPALLLLAATVPVAVWASAFPDLTLPKLTGLILGLAAFRATANWVRTARCLAWAVAAFLLLGLAIAIFGLVGTAFPHKVPALQPVLAALPRVVTGLPGAESGVNPNELGGTLLLFLPVALAACTRPLLPGGRQPWAARLLAAPALAAVLVLTQSRSAWLGAAAGLAATAWLRWPGARALLFAAALALVLGLLCLGPGPALALLFPATAGTGPGLAAGLEARAELWSRALAAIRDFPLTGCGLGTFRQLVRAHAPLLLIPPHVDVAHAHNVFLQVALDLGLPGLVAYLALLGTALRACHRAACRGGGQHAWLAAGLAGSLVAFHVYGLADTVALGARPGAAFWLLLGLVAGLWRVSSAVRTPRGSLGAGLCPAGSTGRAAPRLAESLDAVMLRRSAARPRHLDLVKGEILRALRPSE